MLTVEVISFSYRKGYPAAADGNGGGFVFDCRFLNNPGRIDIYKSLTGKDIDVKDYLRQFSEVDFFLKHVWDIVDLAVAKYIERRFTSLQISFGCTGGQHRSVYCAEETARHLMELFPEIGVNLIHREQR